MRVVQVVSAGQGRIPNAGDGYRCPHCKKLLDGFTALDKEDAKPEPGSLSVCMYCSALMQFVEGGLAHLAAAEFDALPADTRSQLSRTQEAARYMRAQRDKPGLPPAYYRDVETMYQAADKWIREHPCAALSFHQLDERVMYIGALDAHGINLLACNDPARDLLRAMDLSVNQRGTVFQARTVLEFLLAPPGGAES